MSLIESVITRIADQVPKLAGRIDGAAAYSELLRSNAMLQHTLGAFVLPLGMQGGKANAMAGMYVQDVTETVGVMLAWRTFSATAGLAMIDIEADVRAVIAAVAGWAPADASGVFEMVKAGLVDMRNGTVIFQIDFRISDQLRITS